MAVTLTVSQNNANRGTITGSLALSGTYATGGFAVTAGTFGLNQLFSLDVNPTGGMVFEYVPTNSTSGVVKAYWTGAGLSGALAEVTNATSMAGKTPRFEAIGA
jgi:hypothetical protein